MKLNKKILLSSYLIFVAHMRVEAIDLSNLSQDQRSEYNSVVDRINSPFCPGRLLRDCPSSGADKLKVEIADLARSNRSASKIKETLFEKYGDDINPMPSGTVGYFAWILPAIIFVGVLILILIKGNKKAVDA